MLISLNRLVCSFPLEKLEVWWVQCDGPLVKEDNIEVIS